MEKKLSNQATDKQRERERLKEKEGNILVKREKNIPIEADRQTERQTYSPTYSQTEGDRHTHRQTERLKYVVRKD